MRKLLAAIVLLTSFLCTSTVQADLFLTIGRPADIGNANDTPLGPFTAGSSISIPVLAHFEAPILPPLTSYTFTLDFGGDGEGISSFFSTPVFVSAVGGTLVADDALAGALPIDYTMNWIGSTGLSTDSANPSMLFSIEFDSLMTTPEGIYDINFGTDAGSNALTAFTANGANFNVENVQRDNGQFLIVAVPEPSSMLMVFGLGCLAAIGRKRT